MEDNNYDRAVIAAVIIIVTVCAVILLRGLEAEALMN